MSFVKGSFSSIARKIAKIKDIISIRKKIKHLFSDSFFGEFDYHYDPLNTSHKLLYSVKNSKAAPARTFIEDLDN